MAAGIPEGVWGPTFVGGRPGMRRFLTVAVAAVMTLSFAAGATAYSLYWVAESNLKRVRMDALARKQRDQPLNVLVVGSDSREGLTKEEIRRYHLGSFQGQRGDTMILVSITPDREHASVVSLPRDLLVIDGDEERKLNETFAEGPNHVVDVVEDNTGIPIHHYVEISIPGFLRAVETVGPVTICLDESLRDPKSGADFDAGCHDMDPQEALAFVRSRHSERGDFDRMERQQRFIKALLQRLVATRTLVDVPRLFKVVESVASNVTMDSGQGLATMRSLAEELRGLAQGDIPMVVVPSYTVSMDDGNYVIPYDPGARALYRRIVRGLPLRGSGPAEQRLQTRVAVWSAGQPKEADLARRTLFWAKFDAYRAGRGPFEEVAATTVYALPGFETEAGWVAAILGARTTTFPGWVSAPPGAEVVVAVADRTPGAPPRSSRRSDV